MLCKEPGDPVRSRMIPSHNSVLLGCGASPRAVNAAYVPQIGRGLPHGPSFSIGAIDSYAPGAAGAEAPNPINHNNSLVTIRRAIVP